MPQAINGLSVRKKEHKYGCITAAILNLPPHERFKMENLLLLAVAQMKAVAKCGGIMRVACGIDHEVLFRTATLHEFARLHAHKHSLALLHNALFCSTSTCKDELRYLVHAGQEDRGSILLSG